MPRPTSSITTRGSRATPTPSRPRWMTTTATTPDKRFEILRTIVEGPLVALHGRVRHKSNDDPASVIHIFRIEDGRIHELRDVGQDPVEDSPNRAGLF